MSERFTDRARKVMQLANQEAQRFNHEYIGTEHILLGLVKEGSGVAANVLKNLEIDSRKISSDIEKILQNGRVIEKVTMGHRPETPRAKKVIEYSIEESRKLDHNYVGTEHLLLGLLREEEGVAAQVLMNLDLELDEAREEVLNLLGYNGHSGEVLVNRLQWTLRPRKNQPLQDDPRKRETGGGNVYNKSTSVIDGCKVSAYSIPTDSPEADGTFHWNATVLVVVELGAGGTTAIGYTYADSSTAQFITQHLSPLVVGRDAFDIANVWVAMCQQVRNLGRDGIAAMAISTVDIALWNLKATILELPLYKLLGAAREEVAIYGSGGFTSYSIPKLQEQLSGWARQGIPRVKMKIGTHPNDDLERVKAARKSLGADVQLFVDANGAYDRKQALAFAEQFVDQGVTWFEEPVSADDLEGLRLLRDHGPSGIYIAAGEYGYDAYYFRRMLEAGAVDVLQADASRCGGITGFLKVAGLCEAFHLPLSAHCAPALHVHPCCATTAELRHIEYFHDHARIENMLFDGVILPENGTLRPDSTRPGMGLIFKIQDAERFRVWTSH